MIITRDNLRNLTDLPTGAKFNYKGSKYIKTDKCIKMNIFTPYEYILCIELDNGKSGYIKSTEIVNNGLVIKGDTKSVKDMGIGESFMYMDDLHTYIGESEDIGNKTYMLCFRFSDGILCRMTDETVEPVSIKEVVINSNVD